MKTTGTFKIANEWGAPVTLPLALRITKTLANPPQPLPALLQQIRITFKTSNVHQVSQPQVLQGTTQSQNVLFGIYVTKLDGDHDETKIDFELEYPDDLAPLDKILFGHLSVMRLAEQELEEFRRTLRDEAPEGERVMVVWEPIIDTIVDPDDDLKKIKEALEKITRKEANNPHRIKWIDQEEKKLFHDLFNDLAEYAEHNPGGYNQFCAEFKDNKENVWFALWALCRIVYESSETPNAELPKITRLLKVKDANNNPTNKVFSSTEWTGQWEDTIKATNVDELVPPLHRLVQELKKHNIRLKG